MKFSQKFVCREKLSRTSEEVLASVNKFIFMANGRPHLKIEAPEDLKLLYVGLSGLANSMTDKQLRKSTLYDSETKEWLERQLQKSRVTETLEPKEIQKKPKESEKAFAARMKERMREPEVTEEIDETNNKVKIIRTVEIDESTQNYVSVIRKERTIKGENWGGSPQKFSLFLIKKKIETERNKLNTPFELNDDFQQKRTSVEASFWNDVWILLQEIQASSNSLKPIRLKQCRLCGLFFWEKFTSNANRNYCNRMQCERAKRDIHRKKMRDYMRHKRKPTITTTPKKTKRRT